MPRTEIEFGNRVERLSILDEHGEVDTDLEPDLSGEELLAMHRWMLLSRCFDERLLTLQRQGRIGTFAPVRGQEASQIGAVSTLEDSDWMVPAFRETAASLWRGIPMEGLIVLNGGYNEGGEIPEGQRDLPIAIPVASQLPHAVGIAYAAKYRRAEEVVLTFFGDGATSEGDFHEALNFAAVLNVPVVFVCQNNQYAISVPRERQTKSETIAQKCLAYGIPGLHVDGNDVLGVRVATDEAVQRARAGDGPTLIECVTYRLSVHTTADDPSKYRDEDEVEQWKRRDPIPRFEQYLEAKELMSNDDRETLQRDIDSEVDEAWKKAKQRMETLEDPAGPIFEHIYADKPPYLIEQEEAFAEYWSAQSEVQHA